MSRDSSHNSPRPMQFQITGLDCAEEVAVLKREVGPAVGGEEQLSFDILNGRMGVRNVAINPQVVLDAIARTGMQARIWERENSSKEALGFWDAYGRTILTMTSGLLMVAAFLAHAWQGGSFSAAFGLSEEAATPLVAKVLYGLAMLGGVWFILPKAWYALLRMRPDMNLLMTIAVLGAIAIGEWFEAATVAFLFSVSLLLESWSVGRARRAIAALMNLAPPTARILSPTGEEIEVAPSEVSPGTRFLIRPGERIPLDGIVKRGASEVNQASITGESMPVTKEPGVEVFAGTINGDGELQVECTKAANDTTLAQIVRMVGDAQSQRAPSEQWVEKFARIYTPAVMVLSFAVLLVPPLLFGGDWQMWIYNALVLLVIACPCALVISTPVSIVAAVAAAARHGVLVKGGVFMELPAQLKAIAFDKTGTLTSGKATVAQIVPLNGHTAAELLERAAALESRSDHPLAVAIVKYAREQGITPPGATDFRIVQGKGATGRFGERNFWLGSHRYLEARKQETPEVHEQLETLSSAGRSVVVVGNDDHVCGFIALTDSVRPEVPAVLRELREQGVEHLIMLTGDNQATAAAIATEVGLNEFRAELLPKDKVKAMEQLMQQYGSVAMIGDGVNDAPALARATLGIAMGAAGSDAAIETADIALMSDDLSKIAWLIAHSRRTLAIIRQNIFASLAVKLLFVLLTLFGHASLWAAIAADMGVSLLVIFNGLRLLR